MKDIRSFYMKKYSNRMERIIEAVTGEELLEVEQVSNQDRGYTEYKFWATVEEYQVIMYTYNTLYK